MVIKKASKKRGCPGGVPVYSQEDLNLIRERAYLIWEMKGKPQNSASADWLEAEKQLKEEGLI